jgi:hypothetical protein
LGRDQSIADTLVISFTVVVLNVLGDDLAQVPFAKRDHLAQTLLPDRAHEALSERVEIGKGGSPGPGARLRLTEAGCGSPALPGAFPSLAED